VSNAPTSDFTPEPMPSVPGPAQEVEVDLAAFLPEGVTLGEEPAADEPEAETTAAVDLEALSQIERDLDAVDAAIAALDAGTYGTDPATGQLIDDALLAEDPTRLS
jgi:RNA polymerase-binding transcription factor DksA